MLYEAQLDCVEKNFLEQYLQLCGIDKDNITNYLYNVPEYKDNKDANKYINIERAWNTIERFQDSICIVCDSDMDGLLSSSLLAKYLTIGWDIVPTVYFHEEDEKHGVTSALVDFLTERSYDLLIIPDAGSNDLYYTKYLIDQGIVKNILVLDHHDINQYNPYVIMINCTKQDQDNVNNLTSGTGVVWHFLEYMDGKRFDLYPYDLSYVAFSLISDMCDLTAWENRCVIHTVCSNVAYVNPILQSLYSALARTDDITPYHITWSVAPCINSMFRFKDMKTTQLLWIYLANSCCAITEELQNIAKKLRSLHSEQSAMVPQWVDELESYIDPTKNIVVLDGSKYNSRFFGLIATRIERKYHKPTFVLRYENDLWSGSVRSTFPNFYRLCQESGLFVSVQGHESGAFGVSFEGENSQKIINCFQQLNLTSEIIHPVTCCIKDNTIPLTVYEDLDKVKDIWGVGIEEPTFLFQNIKIKGNQIRVMGRNQTTISFKYKGQTYVKFYCSKQWRKDNFIGEDKNLIIDVIGKTNINHYLDNTYYQIMIEYMEVKVDNEERKGEESWEKQF